MAGMKDNERRRPAGRSDRLDFGLAPIPLTEPANPAARAALEAAIRLFERTQGCARPVEMVHALTQIAYALIRLKALEAAESYLEHALHWALRLPGVDTRVDLLCRLAEVACARAEAVACEEADPQAVHRLRRHAREYAGASAALACQAADPNWEARVLLRVADVLENCGDHDDALSVQSRVLALLNLDGRGGRRFTSELQPLTAPAQLM